MDLQKVSLNNFVSKLTKHFDPELIILFGSRSNGTYRLQSDYDFIIVSSKFKGMHWLDRISKIVKLWDYNFDIDVLPYTPEEFNFKKKNSSTVRSAVKTGKIIFNI